MSNVTGEIESLEVVSRPNTEFSKNNRPLKFKKVGENIFQFENRGTKIVNG